MSRGQSALWRAARVVLGVVERHRGLVALLTAVTPLLVLALTQPLPLTLLWDRHEARVWRDSRMLLDWEGFGPEKGLYNFTVVTALLDIGRGDWGRQSRSFNQYLLYMQRVLRLDVNMLVFVQPKGAPMVHWMRRGREHRTRVITATIEDLPYYKYRARIAEIMSSAEYQRDNELARRGRCEATVPEYDVLQWSKLYFLAQALQHDPFNNDYMLWLDAGYGRGEDIHPEDGVWKPYKLLERPDVVTFIERESVEPFRGSADRLHKISVNALAGGFFGGGRTALKRLYRLQQRHLAEWMDAGVVDDDQTVIMQLYFKFPDLFNLVSADWYDAFKVFNKD